MAQRPSWRDGVTVRRLPQGRTQLKDAWKSSVIRPHPRRRGSTSRSAGPSAEIGAAHLEVGLAPRQQGGREGHSDVSGRAG